MTLKSSLGMVAGVVLILSAFAHSLLGWSSMSGRLAQTNAPSDLVLGLKLGWIFGGVVMVVLGLLCLVIFTKRFRGERASTLAPILIAVAYLGFAAWAAIVTSGDPFFFIFAVPGALLAIASIP